MENVKFRHLSELYREEASKLAQEEKGLRWKAPLAGVALGLALALDSPLQNYLIFIAAGATYALLIAEIRVSRIRAHLDNISLHRFMASDYE